MTFEPLLPSLTFEQRGIHPQCSGQLLLAHIASEHPVLPALASKRSSPPLASEKGPLVLLSQRRRWLPHTAFGRHLGPPVSEQPRLHPLASGYPLLSHIACER